MLSQKDIDKIKLKYNENEDISLLIQEISALKQKLRETEPRLSAAMLKVLEDMSCDKEFNVLKDKFEDMKNLDLINYERDRAEKAIYKAELLEDIFNIAKDYMKAKQRWDEVENNYKSGISIEDVNVEKIRNIMISKREKLFSLIKEKVLKERHLELTSQENNNLDV